MSIDWLAIAKIVLHFTGWGLLAFAFLLIHLTARAGDRLERRVEKLEKGDKS
jgi:hypothetical protein